MSPYAEIEEPLRLVKSQEHLFDPTSFRLLVSASANHPTINLIDSFPPVTDEEWLAIWLYQTK
jgi:hypothetical protein